MLLRVCRVPFVESFETRPRGCCILLIMQPTLPLTVGCHGGKTRPPWDRAKTLWRLHIFRSHLFFVALSDSYICMIPVYLFTATTKNSCGCRVQQYSVYLPTWTECCRGIACGVCRSSQALLLMSFFITDEFHVFFLQAIQTFTK